MASQGLKKLTDKSGTQVSLQLTNVIVGSQCFISRNSDSAILMNKIATSSTVTEPYIHTVDEAVTIRVRKSSIIPKYKPFSSGGTITSDGLNVYVSQVLDDIASS